MNNRTNIEPSKTRKILVLRGLQQHGSGKTKFAKQWVAEDPKNRVRFNRDDIRNMLGPYWVPSRESLINGIYYHFIMDSMKDDYNIVIDNMNLNDKNIKEIQDIIDEHNELLEDTADATEYELEIKDFFDVPLETCIERDSKRENPIGEKVIRQTYNRYKSKIAPWKYL